jgi:penicillin-binding protein 1A
MWGPLKVTDEDRPVKAAPEDKTVAPARRRTLLRFLLKWTAVSAIWAFVLIGAVVLYFAADLPDVDQALQPTRKPAITVLAADGSELATVGDYFGDPVTIRQLPKALPQAVLATEDRRFYRHFGVDVIGLVRAMAVNVQAGAVVQGGSTITQQAAKNLFLTHERTIKRKVQELLLALWLEHRFTKDQIFAIYLNRAYFGAGAHGVDAASRKFFGVPATRVSLYQSAVLAGLLKAPSRDNPIASPLRARQRANEVLANMVEAGYLTPNQVAQAQRQGTGPGLSQRTRPIGRHFVDWVVAQAPGLASAPDRDLLVRTTLDPRLQRLAEASVAGILDGPAARKAAAGEAALVAMTADGAVRAMVGGRNYGRSSFNRATQAYRQPGSAFKPIVYVAGLEQGLSADSRFVDSPLRLAGWQPSNFTNRYLGEVSLRHALAESINTVAVQVGEHAGRRHVIDVARRLGITADLAATPSLSLGTREVSVVELTAAYAAFANGGTGVWAYGVEEITDGDGRVVYRRSGSGPGRAISRGHAAQITDMLVTAVTSGTGRAALLDRPTAGKTGTSQNFRDAWFVGYTADLVAGVWMGNDDDRPMVKVTGGGLPAQLWRAFMAEAHAGRPPRPLPSLPPAAAPAPPSPAATEATRTPEPSFWDRLLEVFGG